MPVKPKLRKNGEPLYRQIAERLREEIGDLNSGTRIPSEPQLARDWGVSRFTVAKAVEELVDEGLITRRQGSGTFVAEAPLRRQPGYLLSFTEAVSAAGHVATHRLLAFEPMEWQPGVPYPQGAPLVLFDRLRFVDGIAMARHRSVLSAELAAAIGLTRNIAGEPTFSLYRFFDEHDLSVEFATEQLYARAAEPVERELLDLDDNAVVVAVNRRSFAADGTLLDAVDATYDARRYSYEAQLVRRHRLVNEEPQKENDNAEIAYDAGRHNGPRLGPWDAGGNGS